MLWVLFIHVFLTQQVLLRPIPAGLGARESCQQNELALCHISPSFPSSLPSYPTRKKKQTKQNLSGPQFLLLLCLYFALSALFTNYPGQKGPKPHVWNQSVQG